MKVPTWIWWLMDPYKAESKKIDPMLIKLARVLPPGSDAYKMLLSDSNFSRTVQESMFCRRFTYAEIKKATVNFKEKINEGRLYIMYKGYFEKWNIPIAIKLFEDNSAVKEIYNSEIEVLCTLRHENFIGLIGYGNENGKRFLVYNFTSKGTLYDHLHGNKNPLDWKQRLQICIGVARGLHHLHTASNPTVIHRDVKSSNILLDENFRPKLSGFDICARKPFEDVVAGTIGYIDPQLMITCEPSEKSDVYSFGVVLHEVVCARRVWDFQAEDNMGIVAWAKNYTDGGKVYEIVDKHLQAKIAPECLNKYLEVAHSCVRSLGIHRPTMNGVLKGLEIAMELQEKADAAKRGGDCHHYNYYDPEASWTCDSPQSFGSIGMEEDFNDLLR